MLGQWQLWCRWLRPEVNTNRRLSLGGRAQMRLPVLAGTGRSQGAITVGRGERRRPATEGRTWASNQADVTATITRLRHLVFQRPPAIPGRTGTPPLPRQRSSDGVPTLYGVGSDVEDYSSSMLMGIDEDPRSSSPPVGVGGANSSTSAIRWPSISKAIWASSRASGAPRQRWIPLPNPR